MLHDAQRTSAPSATSVSISTAVWIVMCSDPAIRAPVQRLARTELGAQRHQARHLGLGDLDLLAAEVGQRDVLDDVIGLHPEKLLRWAAGPVRVALSKTPRLDNRARRR